jgi:hypothetical protein
LARRCIRVSHFSSQRVAAELARRKGWQLVDQAASGAVLALNRNDLEHFDSPCWPANFRPLPVFYPE